MGGLREDTIKSSAPAKKGDAVTYDGNIRFHEDPDTGQVHFHDDACGLKVGMPVATWYSLWQRIKHAESLSECYVDTEHNTALIIKSGLSSFTTPQTLECVLSIIPIQQSETIQKLDRFMPNKRRF